MINAVRSAAEQDYPGDVELWVTDFGSSREHFDRIRQVCREFGATLVRVETNRVWSRSRALNLGIRQVSAPFILTCDVDIMLAPNYVSACVDAVKRAPLSALFNVCLDLNEDTVGLCQQLAEGRGPVPWEKLRRDAAPRFEGTCSYGIVFVARSVLQYIGGYNEAFVGWGCEDDDIERRLRFFGLDKVSLHSDTFYLHQWHPKHEGMTGSVLEKTISRNRERFRRSARLRHSERWGELRPGERLVVRRFGAGTNAPLESRAKGA